MCRASLFTAVSLCDQRVLKVGYMKCYEHFILHLHGFVDFPFYLAASSHEAIGKQLLKQAPP